MLGTAVAKRAPRAPQSIETPSSGTAPTSPAHMLFSMMQDLSQARTLDGIIALVREQARALTGADGVTFILKDGDYCHYVDENAIGPLWKGRRFPLNSCVSGWAMQHRESAVIEDIYTDARIPLDAYRATFVKSMAMVPIRRSNPIGAIGTYWAAQHQVSETEIMTLQALADSVSVAMENVALYAELQAKVKQLQESNHELSRFAWVASHDLQEPLRTITTQSEMLARHYKPQLDARAGKYIETVTGSARRLQHLVEDLLVHARIEQSEHFKPVVLGEVVDEVMRDMSMSILESGASIACSQLPWLWGERVMLGRLFQNLISNGIKFCKPGVAPVLHIVCAREDSSWHITVRDHGIGIEEDQRERIFGLFQRVHTQAVYPGSGIGLATCKKIVELHHGRIWVESVLGEGSVFHIMLPFSGDDMKEVPQ